MALLIRLSTFFFLAAAANLVACVNATFSFPTFAADARLTYAGTSVYYSKQRDICGVCDGDGSTCVGTFTVDSLILISIPSQMEVKYFFYITRFTNLGGLHVFDKFESA